MAYEVNYDDERFKEVESDKKAALSEIEKTYGDMAGQANQYFEAQINATKDWENKQTQLQQEQTDFAIEQIEQQKAQAEKDYKKEQSAAYVDWQKQSNRYGANAEQMAASGLFNDGYSESAQVSMYNTYQNRVMTSLESYNNAKLNFDNGMREAKLQNNSVLAEIAYKSLQDQLQLSLTGFQYTNQLVLDKVNAKTQADQMYYNRYQDVLAQINTENALAEQIRQYNEQMAFEREQWDYQTNKSKGGGSPNLYYIDPDETDDTAFNGTTYEEAVAYMEANGVDKTRAVGILTKAEFQKAQNMGSKRHGADLFEDYGSYLQSVTKDFVDNYSKE